MPPASALELRPATIDTKPVLRQLLELCQHDYSQFNGADISQHGHFGYDYLDNYWTEPGRFAFIVHYRQQIAGFALVRRLEQHADGAAHHAMAEFFILRKYRRQGLGSMVAQALFARFPGTWIVGQEPHNQPAQRFWRAVIAHYTSGQYQEHMTADGPRQEFQSPPEPSKPSAAYAGTDFYCDQVLSGRTAVVTVHETAGVLAFQHTRPHWPVHIVVIPKQHIASLLDISSDTTLLQELLAVVQQVAAEVVANHGGCHVVTNLGTYQDSKHLHWHIGAGEPLRS